jgi:DNA-binding LacI/PurR family transcriptional regulator
MATIYEVSEFAGVSLATVSRVMNNSGNVRAKTRKKVEQAIAEPGYRPNSFQDRPSSQTVKQKPKSKTFATSLFFTTM